jgi:hypothetical protein
LIRPLLEGTDETLFVLKACALGHLLDGLAGSLQEFNGAFAAHFVFDRLQADAFFFELPVQAAR